MMKMTEESEEPQADTPQTMKRTRILQEVELEVQVDLKSRVTELEREIVYLKLQFDEFVKNYLSEINKKPLSAATKKVSSMAAKSTGTRESVQQTKPNKQEQIPTVSSKPAAGVENPWIKVVKKNLTKEIKSQTNVLKTQNLKETLNLLPSESKIQILLKKTIPLEERIEQVTSVMVQLPLSQKAQRQPMTAWKEAIKAITGQTVLAVSLVHPCKAEIFVDEREAQKIKTILENKNYLVTGHQLSDRDLKRRKTSYLHGYFRPLRRAMMQGFSKELQLDLLTSAEGSLQAFFKDKSQRTQWSHHVAADREWLSELDVDHTQAQQESSMDN
jgi:hypothetical protein